MKILGIDPGNTQSGVVVFEEGGALVPAILPNEDVLGVLRDTDCPVFACEMIHSQGMAVGASVFDTCVWVGRMVQTWLDAHPDRPAAMLIYRRDVKLHVCGSPRANDGTIRASLINRFGAPGTAKARGPTYGVTSHAWQALATAVTAADRLDGRAYTLTATV